MNPTIDPIALRKIALQVLILLGLLFGAAAWSQRPEGALVWLTGMLTLPMAWILVAATGALPGSDHPAMRRHIYNSLIGAGVLVTGALGVVAAVALEAIPEDWSTRFGMLSSALVLIVIGNGLPKKIEPGCSRTRGLAIQRLLGWTFVVTGLIAAVVWLTVPMTYARAAGLSVYGIAVLFAIVAVVRIRRSAPPG
jgi:hypothetical protein